MKYCILTLGLRRKGKVLGLKGRIIEILPFFVLKL